MPKGGLRPGLSGNGRVSETCLGPISSGAWQARTSTRLSRRLPPLATVQLKMAGVSGISINSDGRRAVYGSPVVSVRGCQVRSVSTAAGRLVNTATGVVAVQKKGHHINLRAKGTLTLPGRGTLRFPVQGARREYAVMSAVDESGLPLVKYRFSDPVPTRTAWGLSKLEGAEVVIAPDLRTSIESMLLLIALSTEWLWSYFVKTGGG